MATTPAALKRSLDALGRCRRFRIAKAVLQVAKGSQRIILDRSCQYTKNRKHTHDLGHWNPWSPDSFFLLLILSRVGLFHIQFAAAAERAEAEASCHFGIPFLGLLLHEAVGAQLNVSSFGKARQALILTCLVPAGGGSPAVPAVSSLSFARIQCSHVRLQMTAGHKKSRGNFLAMASNR